MARDLFEIIGEAQALAAELSEAIEELTDGRQLDFSNRVELAGLWQKTIGNETYYQGPVGYNSALVIVRNGAKNAANQPDYIAYLIPKGGNIPTIK